MAENSTEQQENSKKTATPLQAGSLEGGPASLFGEQVVTRARRCKVEDLDFSPDEIVQAARALRGLSGKPAEQVMMARCLPDDVQTALCMWMTDSGMQAKVLKARGVRLQ
jgi:hypothetical protein